MQENYEHPHIHSAPNNENTPVPEKQRKQIGVYFLLSIAVVLGALLISGGFLYQTYILSEKIGSLESQLKAAIEGANPAPKITDPVTLFKDSPKKDVQLSGEPAIFIGQPSAPIHVIAYEDFQCPFCQRFFLTTFPSFKADYIDTGKAKFTPRNYPFLGEESVRAAESLKCAQKENKFWEFREALYQDQGPENAGSLTTDKLVGFAKKLGLNTNSFKSCVDSREFKNTVTTELEEAERNGVNATPTFFINGKQTEGALTYDELKSMLDYVATTNE